MLNAKLKGNNYRWISLNEKKDPSAKEIYLAALALNKSPAEAFKFIYGHLKLNPIKEQERLRKSYETRRN